MRQKIWKYMLMGIAWMLGAISCSDDEFISSVYVGEGEATLQATISFTPFTEGLESRTAGNAIKEIQNLCIIVYDKNEVFYKSFYQDKPKQTLVNRIDADTGEEGAKKAELQTPQVTLGSSDNPIKLPYGIYSIYAVANMGNLEDASSILGKHKEAIETGIDGLKNVSLSWNSNTIANNNQMFGHFTAKTVGSSEEKVVVNAKQVELHAWIKRAASKVTVAFNGANLNENVYITVKSVQIKDIPSTCLLGAENTPDEDGELINAGEIINYSDYNNGVFPIISKGGVDVGESLNIEGWKTEEGSDKDFDPTNYVSQQNVSQAHTEDNVALYFYENMQGVGNMTDCKDDKSVNSLIYTEKGKKYGSYIEVMASYENRNQGKVTSGDIIYRFMLGKNVTTNYDAERNYHYKLTLCFNKDANDVDWRIDYNEDPGIYIPNPYYISYLYNENMTMPLRVTLEDGDQLVSLKGEIVMNNWQPTIPEGAEQGSLNNWFGDEYDTYKGVSKSIKIAESLGDTDGNNLYPWLGFLSLRNEWKKNESKIWGKETVSHPMTLGILENSGSDGYSFNQYVADVSSDNHESWWNNQKLGQRTYYENSNLTHDGETDTPTVERQEDGSVDFNIPLYTRVKQLFIVSGFTGNNPFQAFDREAKVRFTATTKNGKTYTNTVTIKQVPRIVNPTGIYRDADESEGFTVNLTVLSADGNSFVPLYSDGPWRASVLKGEDWIGITNGTGSTGSPVSFTYQPKGQTGSSRCGIIKVEYNNYTCSHLIFVRQGYDPVQLTNNGPFWASFNMEMGKAMASDPRDEGSLYRYGKWEYPIAEKNNQTFGFGEDPEEHSFAIEGNSETKKWIEIGSVSKTDNIGTPIDGWRVPTRDEWQALLTGCKVGYGVLYAGGATATQIGKASAFEYSGEDKTKGMRGAFVYNPDTGANIFLPIGALGYGHRKQQHTNSEGSLRYAQSDFYITSNVEYRPMLYDLCDQNGAVYWTSTDGHGWDINYNQLDFNVYLQENAWKDGTSDACFIRLVKE